MTDLSKTTFINLNELKSLDLHSKTAVLTFVGGPQVGRQILLAKDTITLGRANAATILINDGAVSRIHIKIVHDALSNSYSVNDLGSSNGTFLNFKKIENAVLNEGDKIGIGQTVLRFSWNDPIDIAFNGEVDKLINVDDLTGLVLKRRFDEELSRHVAVSLLNETPLTLFMMDMDGLKKVNDTYGHVFGAHSISETGKIIKTAISSNGLASRFGGDEFMAFLPNTPVDKAMQVAEGIRHDVEHHPYEKDNIRFSITISIGLAGLKNNETPEMILKRADAALYMAKKKGRNTICIADD
ncbi:MAG: GGDEF domain-containing protein [Pseudomonadota bacterium]